jgi:hypothetical protein
MTSQAGLAKVLDLPLGSYFLMRIVATDATQFTSWAPLKAQAFVHLLDMVHRLAVVFDLGSSDVDRPKFFKRQTWPKVIQPAAALQHARRSLQVTLLADCLSQRRLQLAGVDDVVLLGAFCMQLARAMTAFAADRVALEHRFLKAIPRPFDWLDAVRVAI